MYVQEVEESGFLQSDVKIANTTQAQQGLFFRCRIDSQNPAYNVSCAYRLVGSLNVAALEKSIGSLVNRHETLRTRFKLETAGLTQHILPCSASSEHHEFTRPSLRKLPENLSEKKLSNLLNEEINKPFDLDKGPLFRCILFSSVTENQHVFLFVVHHLIFDHRSKSIFNFELSNLYNHFANQQPLQLEELEHQFSDYVEAKEKKSTGAAFERQHKYWLKKLDNLEPPAIPLDRPRSAPPTSRGIRIEKYLPDSLVASLKSLAGEHQSTVFIAALAVAKVLIARWTGEDDISLGTHYADRRYPGGEKMLGFLLNTLVLRSNIGEHTTFSDFLNSVQKTCFQAYRYSDVPFEKLVESMLVDRSYERNPFFDVRFTHLKDHEQSLSFGGMEAHDIDLEECRARYDLTLTLLEKTSGYRIQIEYRTALFERNKMEWLLDRYIGLLETITSNPQIFLKQLTLVDANIRHRLLNEFNHPGTPFPKEKPVQQLISEQAYKTPDTVAIQFQQHQITYKELDAETNKLAQHLHSIGVLAGTVVAVSIDRSINMIKALLGVLKSGATYLPIDHHYPEDRIKHMVEDSGCAYIITDSSTTNALPELHIKHIHLDNDRKKIAACTDAPLNNVIDTNKPAYIIYTSGSTGMPKGVLVTHKNVVNFLCSMQKRPGLKSGDKLVAVTTLSFDIAVLEIWLPLICGATSIIAATSVVGDGDRLIELLTAKNANVMQATPITWRLLLGAGWEGGAHFKALCGGEALPPDLAKSLYGKVGELWNMYGPTETTVWSSCCKIDNPYDPIHIGAPIDNTTFYILNSAHQLVPPGASGELFIGGEGVTAGYHNRTELSKEKFIANPFGSEGKLYATGDAARFTSSGNIEFIARMDNQVKIRGLRIELGEIETQLNSHVDVLQSAVVVREDTPGDQRIVAYYESNNIDQNLITDLRRTLKQALPHYMIPQQWVRLDKLPLTPNGKLDRKSLPAVIQELSNKSSAQAATKLEQKMADIWADVLGVESVPVDTTFFDLGGHSLLAMHVIARARQELQIEIKPMSMVGSSLRELVMDSDPEARSSDTATSSYRYNDIETFFFENDELYARLHKPDKNQCTRGAVLFCNPLYIESNNIHWGYQRLSTVLAEAGFYVLRFDYYGTGNSLGEDEEGNTVRWQKDIAAAANQLLNISNQDSLSLVGFRYGATLASTLKDVPLNTIVLWEPVIDSSAHVNTLHKKYKKTVKALNEYINKKITEHDSEITGYSLTDSTRESIAQPSIQLAELIDKYQHVALVTSENGTEYKDFIDKAFSNKPKHLLEKTPSSNRKLDLIVVDDKLPSIEVMYEPSAWLPGKSLFQIVKLLKDTHNA